jgi:hypothetical protein
MLKNVRNRTASLLHLPIDKATSNVRSKRLRLLASPSVIAITLSAATIS